MRRMVMLPGIPVEYINLSIHFKHHLASLNSFFLSIQ
jgi:hypothetical protein